MPAALEAPQASPEIHADLSMPESGDDLARLDSMITADEAADAAAAQKGSPDSSLSRSTPPRAGNGQFVKAGADAAAGSTPKPDTSSGTPPTTPTATPPTGEGQAQTPPPGEPQSRWQKAKEREAKAWKQINEEKLTLAAERAKIDADRAELARGAQQGRAQAPAAPTLAEPRYTAADYVSAARAFEARARAAEAAGNFTQADEDNQLAADARKAAEEAVLREGSGGQQQPGQAAQPARTDERAQAWAKAKADFPQIIDPQNPANKEMLAFVKAHPAVLEYPQGPYLAAQFVVAQQLAGKVPALEKEAGRVPELVKQVETLSAKVKELQALTALPDGGDPSTREDTRGLKPFSQLSTAEMEAQLERELAEA